MHTNLSLSNRLYQISAIFTNELNGVSTSGNRSAWRRWRRNTKNHICRSKCGLWQGMKDSNPHKRSQSPVCYHYTNPLRTKIIILQNPKMSTYFFENSENFYLELFGVKTKGECGVFSEKQNYFAC